jgi:DNA-binding transcriptional MerR regulator
MTTYSIRDLERLTGIRAHTLRIWEQRYNILTPGRSGSNIREYSDHDLRRILNVTLLHQQGLKISAIAKFNEEQLTEEVSRLLLVPGNENAQITTMVHAMLNFDQRRFQDILERSIRQFGFESCIENIVFPFLRQTGDLWQLGLVSPAQEHYASNLIRQKLIVGLEQIESKQNNYGKSFLFFLPPGELHEFVLLYLSYLALMAGHCCFYLGQSVPVDDLIQVSEKIKPDVMVSVFTSAPEPHVLPRIVDMCNGKLVNSKLLLTGRFIFNSSEQQLPSKESIQKFRDFSEFRKHL